MNKITNLLKKYVKMAGMLTIIYLCILLTACSTEKNEISEKSEVSSQESKVVSTEVSTEETTDTETTIQTSEENGTVEEKEDGSISIKTESGKEIKLDSKNSEVNEEADGSKTYITSDGTMVNVTKEGEAKVIKQEVVDTNTGNTIDNCQHEWVEATCLEPKHCKKCGLNATFTGLGHSFSIEATCESPRKCANCGLEDGNKLEHIWQPATETEPETCALCGKTRGKALGTHVHEWKEADCYEAKTCETCGEKEGTALGHDYQWVVIQEAAPGVDGYKSYKCSRCGKIDFTDGMETIPALPDGQETPWVYSNNNTHREKTMYDGTILKEDLITLGYVSMWGWFDDAAASEMNTAVNNMLINSGVYQPFVVDSAYAQQARDNAFAYAYTKSSSEAYHSGHGGTPNVSDNQKYITLSDGCGQSNYIGCFVRDSYGGTEDFTYGQYWKSYFGTYYASGNF